MTGVAAAFYAEAPREKISREIFSREGLPETRGEGVGGKSDKKGEKRHERTKKARRVGQAIGKEKSKKTLRKNDKWLGTDEKTGAMFGRLRFYSYLCSRKWKDSEAAFARLCLLASA